MGTIRLISEEFQSVVTCKAVTSVAVVTCSDEPRSSGLCPPHVAMSLALLDSVLHLLEDVRQGSQPTDKLIAVLYATNNYTSCTVNLRKVPIIQIFLEIVS